MFSLPVSSYKIEGKVNVTLQSLNMRIVEDIIKLGTDGIRTDSGAATLKAHVKHNSQDLLISTKP